MKHYNPNRNPLSEIQHKVFCILSDKRVYRSKSPEIFSSVMKRTGIKGAYVPFMVSPGELGEAVRSIRVLNMAGANITAPFKEVVIPYLDVLSEGAKIIGAVNTIVRVGDQLKGYNTNAIGFMDALEEIGFSVAGKSAVIFGTGGMAKAVAFILSWLRADSILIAGRNETKAMQVVHRTGGNTISIDALKGRSVSTDILINATSVSSYDESEGLAALVNTIRLNGCEMVFDLNYGRTHNFWEDLAARHDIPFHDGLSSLAHQARRTFALWTTIQVPHDEFIRAIQGA